MVSVYTRLRYRAVFLLLGQLLVIQTWMYPLGLVVLSCINCLRRIKFWVANRDWDICFEFMSHFYLLLLSGCRLGDNASTLLGEDSVFVTFGESKFGRHISWIALLSQYLHKCVLSCLKSILVSVRISFLH